ncbi:MAG: hypothetical protein QW056_06485 [Candidatus Bathyarchaeia archaeon]
MSKLMKGIVIGSLIAAFISTFSVTLYCSVFLSTQVSRSNTLLYTKLAELERLSEKGIIPDISVRKSLYEITGSVVQLWDFYDLVKVIQEKASYYRVIGRSLDVLYQESHYVFPFKFIPAKVWVVIDQTTYVFIFL